MPADLTYLAADVDLRPLWRAVHGRLCAGTSPEAINSVRVPALSTAGVAQLRTWLDTSTRRRRSTSAVILSGNTATVPLRELLAVLGIDRGTLIALVEQAVGEPVVDRSAATLAAADRRARLWQHAAEELSDLPQLVARMRATGVGEDDTELRHSIAALAAALRRIPARPPVPLAKLAHDITGDPHYFDLTTLGGNRLVAAVAERAGQPEPTRPDLVRALLATVGIIADRLSATVLLLNVEVVGDGLIDRRLHDSSAPVALTLLDLLQHPPTLAPQTLTVVENPSVVEIAVLDGRCGLGPGARTSRRLRRSPSARCMRSWWRCASESWPWWVPIRWELRDDEPVCGDVPLRRLALGWVEPVDAGTDDSDRASSGVQGRRRGLPGRCRGRVRRRR